MIAVRGLPSAVLDHGPGLRLAGPAEPQPGVQWRWGGAGCARRRGSGANAPASGIGWAVLTTPGWLGRAREHHQPGCQPAPGPAPNRPVKTMPLSDLGVLSPRN
jgi:hypothetical protein